MQNSIHARISGSPGLFKIANTVGLATLFFCLTCTTSVTANSGNTRSEHCIAFAESSYYREPTKSTVVNPSNWVHHIDNAQDGEEILLADGTYPLEQYTVVLNSGITLRGESGNPGSVIIEGKGYSENAEALMVMANDAHIADLTIRNVRDHGISVQEGFSKPVIYNVNLIDIGTQHIKGNNPGPDGTIACSRLGYTSAISKGDYNSAIDLHKAVGWTIRDNYIYNIYGDGSGCFIDKDCGSLWPGGEPAILLWRGSKDNIIERNTIIDSFRAIALGLDTEYSGGVVKNNYICRNDSGKNGVNGFIKGDAGISLSGASDVRIENNRILLPGDYPGQIEIRDGSAITVANNTLSKPIWNRGNAEYSELNNIEDADISNIVCEFPDGMVMASLSSDLSETNSSETDVLIKESNESMETLDAAIGNLVAHFEQSHDTAYLLMEVRLERLKAMEERLLATSERLKAKEERLRTMQLKLLIEERLNALELTNKSIDIKLAEIQRLLQEQ